MTTEPTFLIVGGGLAGAIAAQTLREEGFDGRITLLGAESNRPYERPPLSKDYLQGNADRDSVFVHPEPWYADHACRAASGRRRDLARPSLADRHHRHRRTAGLRQAAAGHGLDTPTPQPARLRPRRRALPAQLSRTVTASRPASRGHSESPSSAPAGSGWRPPPLPATRDWT